MPKDENNNNLTEIDVSEDIQTIKITNEDEAFEVITEALGNNLPDNVQIEFKGWPILHIKLKGDDFKGTMPTRIMHPILDLQKELNKVYCREKYGTDNTNRLTDEERENLELIIQVNEGSSEYFANICKAMTELAKATNMSGKDVVLLVTVLATSYTATTSWKSWLTHEESKHNIEQTVRLSEEETKRQALLADAINNNTKLILAAEGADNVKNEFAKRLKPRDSIEVNGEVIMDGAHAKKIVKTIPVEPEDIRIDDIFVITDVSFPQELGQPYKLSVKKISDKSTLVIEASHAAITDDQIAVIKDAGFGIKRVLLSINAKKKNDRIYNAKLVGISLNISNTNTKSANTESEMVLEDD